MIVRNSPTFDRYVVPSKPSYMSHNLDPSPYAINQAIAAITKIAFHEE